MTVQIDVNHPFIDENGVHQFVCFASDVGSFRNGFPKVVTTNIGNGQPFVGHRRKLNKDGDLEYVVYLQQLGCVTLKVFND